MIRFFLTIGGLDTACRSVTPAPSAVLVSHLFGCGLARVGLACDGA